MLRESRRRSRASSPAPPPAAQRTPNGSRPRQGWRVLPFDYAATIRLEGVPGNLAQGVITIGPDAAFVATGIGYGFAEELERPIENAAISPPPGTPPGAPFVPRDITLAQLPPRALVDGFRLNPRSHSLVFDIDPDTRVFEEPEQLFFRGDAYPFARRGEIFQRRLPNENIAFLLSIIDSATGRELQDEPIHNLAALGSDDGRRPFRPLAKPMAFLPRSTIRLQVIERLSQRTGQLDIVLFGFKVPAAAAASEETIRQVLASEPPIAEQFFGSRVIPFDYVAQLPLRGRAGLESDVELPINVEGSFVTTSISYALDTQQLAVPIDLSTIRGTVIANASTNTFDLAAVTLERLPSDALIDGIRLRPSYARIAFDNGGDLNNAVRTEIANDLFERLNRPESVAFRYRFHDAGAGRDLQNQMIHSVAGLGIANGQRPFKRLTRPLTFEPRSTLRVSVKEISGRGMLHIVFQGYKRLVRGTT